MSTATRIYVVSDGNADRLIRATSKAQAIHFATRTTYTARVATQDDLATLLPAGVMVESATEEAQP